MSEFKLQHLVDELLNKLGGKVAPDRLIEYLQKSLTINADNGCSGTQVAIQTHLASIVQDIANPDSFMSKYKDLKDKNVYCLNAYVQLLDNISQDAGVKEFLLKSAKHPSSSLNTELTKDDLPHFKNRLKKAVTSKSRKDDSFDSILNISSTLPLATTPSVSSWVQRRPSMSWDFSTHNFSHAVPTVPPVSQENILIEDLLNVLIGLPGCYIEPEELKDMYGPRTFKINDSVSLSLKELVKQILPLASHYSVIQRFIEEKMRFEFGQVNNALAEAMQSINKDHMLFIIQLESEFRANNLTLQKLWFFVQRNMQSLGIAANIASSISKSGAKGGNVLSLLHENVIGSIGDERAQQLCLKLMEAACEPYMKMLGMWIYRGIISDPIKEITKLYKKEDMPVDYSADYWDKKYAVRRERIPKFLESVSDMILKAGKYLNVIRQCGKPVKNKVIPIQYKIEEKTDLIGRLRSVKHYFLLDQGDFIVTFLALCEKEFGKYVVDVNQGCIESLMDLALRLSSAISDPYKEDLKTELLPYDLQFQMFKILSIQTNSEQEYWSSTEPKKLLMIESFSFGYEVHWPLSLILNRKSLACYQMIFRHLFYCKYIERMICQVWKSNKVAKKFHLMQLNIIEQLLLYAKECYIASKIWSIT
ncbi:hypothetical protein NQ318_022878 [Aromia moschata]|uniref:Gamma-tubulin complex component n=1 Tax=Aromia moschata TaxID=1265417 RepID=A0AAV8XHF7_9CUCU|nr:hypothetical protein NQ318_022878 [Aromia moschata]